MYTKFASQRFWMQHIWGGRVAGLEQGYFAPATWDAVVVLSKLAPPALPGKEPYPTVVEGLSQKAIEKPVLARPFSATEG
jgi:hypothetical protein